MLRVYEPFVAKNQLKYVTECINTNFLSFHGRFTKLLEKSIEDKFGINHCIMTTSGSTALFTVYSVLKELRKWKRPVAITSTMTYAATASSLILAGYDVKFVEHGDDLQIDLKLLKKALEYEKPQLLVIPSVYGNMPDFVEINKLCELHGVELVEDSAESFGCRAASGTFSGATGIAGCFSFFVNKVVTCGEGGAIVTNDDRFAQLCRDFINQGSPTGYMHWTIGTNFRLTNIQAAIGYAQMEQYDEIVQLKKYIAEFYRTNLDKRFVPIIPSCYSTEWMPVFRLPNKRVGLLSTFDKPAGSYKHFAAHMNAADIEVRPVFHPLNRMPAFSGRSSTLFPRPNKRSAESHFILPSSPNLTNEQLKFIVETANKYE